MSTINENQISFGDTDNEFNLIKEDPATLNPDDTNQQKRETTKQKGETIEQKGETTEQKGETFYKEGTTQKEYTAETEQNEELSLLSYSSYDSLENDKIAKMGQYTCNECSEIPKIIDSNISKKTIIIKCKKHGQKEINIRDYLINSLNYNPNNWKCANSEHIQKTSNSLFKYCECGKVFCEQCYTLHKSVSGHKQSIDSDKYFLYCKKIGHFDERFVGYCYECNDNYCKICENDHIKHSKMQLNTMEVGKKEIDKLQKLNKEYRSLITYYESLIKLNNLIIHSYENNRDNYYNLFNINSIISNANRNNLIEKENYYQSISPGENNKNIINYINNLYAQNLNEEETFEIKIDNKSFNNFDLKILTQIPLNNLKILELDNNNITKIDCLEYAKFPELVVLSLKNNSIEDISVLGRVNFEELQGILLSNNNITDINIFERIKFKKLRLIDLRNNRIADISVFQYMDKKIINTLECIYLNNNKFDLNKFDKVQSILENCDECILASNE